MKTISAALPVLGFALSIFCSSTVGAATITYSWTGTIVEVVTDDNTGVYAGTSIGSSFSGAFTFDPDEANILGVDTSDGDSIVEPTDTWAEYDLGSGSASITNGTTALGADNAGHSITNNHPLDEPVYDEIFDDLLGKPVPLGTPIDEWDIFAEVGDVEFLVSYFSLLTTMYGDVSFRSTPPWSPSTSPGDSNNQIAYFEILEGDKFFAYGTITAVTVPVPAAAWLFCSALGMLGWMRRWKGVENE